MYEFEFRTIAKQQFIAELVKSTDKWMIQFSNGNVPCVSWLHE